MIDITNFKKEAITKHKSRKKFILKLKNQENKKLDALFNDADNSVFEKIDCLTCASCCKNVGPLFTNKDIQRISKILKLSQGDFVNKYLKIDDDDDYVLKTTPCVFLMKDNYCSIYEIRPKACREYPHTQMKNQKKLLKLNLKNCEHCPAVNEIFNKICC
jgi:Fe-S-cluster containining protein